MGGLARVAAWETRAQSLGRACGGVVKNVVVKVSSRWFELVFLDGDVQQTVAIQNV